MAPFLHHPAWGGIEGVLMRGIVRESPKNTGGPEQARELAQAVALALYANPQRVGLPGGATRPAWGFHQDLRGGRLLQGGNKSAKSTAGLQEARWWMLGKHPFRRTPAPPLHGRVVVPKLPGSTGSPHPIRTLLEHWMQPTELRGGSWAAAYEVAAHTLYLANGSFLEFMGSDQPLSIHASANRHFVWFDEETPEAIWAENLARLVGGGWWMTFAPIGDQWWIKDRLHDPALKGERTDLGVHHVDIEDNRQNLPAGTIEELEANYQQPWQREARLRGRWVRPEGLVFTECSTTTLTADDFDFGAPRGGEGGSGGSWPA